MYLTGATLFLSLLLARVFYIILDFIQVQESYTALQAKTAKASGAAGENEELRNRIAELEAKERDFGKLGAEIADHAADMLSNGHVIQKPSRSKLHNRMPSTDVWPMSTIRL